MRRNIKLATVVLFFFITTACNIGERNNSRTPTLEITNSPNETSVLVPNSNMSFYDFAFVANNKFIVLASGIDTNWMAQRPQFYESTGNEIRIAISSAKENALPAEYSAVLNTKFKVFDNIGNVYIATIVAIKLMAAEIPHFGQYQQWGGQQDGVAASEDVIASDIWNSGDKYVVAEFVLDSNVQTNEWICCAVSNDKPRPIVFSESDSSDVAYRTEDIINEIIKTAEYETIKAGYAESGGDTSVYWWNESPSYPSFYVSQKGKRYGILNNSAGEICSDKFGAELLSVWSINESQAPELLYIDTKCATVILVLDIDNDDIPEFILSEGFGKFSFLKQINGTWLKARDWIVPYHDCPC